MNKYQNIFFFFKTKNCSTDDLSLFAMTELKKNIV